MIGRCVCKAWWINHLEFSCFSFSRSLSCFISYKIMLLMRS